jgi:hypothetical protein
VTHFNHLVAGGQLRLEQGMQRWWHLIGIFEELPGDFHAFLTLHGYGQGIDLSRLIRNRRGAKELGLNVEPGSSVDGPGICGLYVQFIIRFI